MKRFITWLSLFVFIAILSMLLVYSLADGSTDAFYAKFTSPKQSSMIIGSSRAAQGLQPIEINPILSEYHLYNFAFSRVHTPFGKPYFNAIKQKLDLNKEKHLFLIEVNPWSVSEKSNEAEHHMDVDFFKRIFSVNSDPNLGYLLNVYDDKNIKIITKRFKSDSKNKLFVHDDGWFEVSISENEKAYQKRLTNSINSYKRLLKDYDGLSDYRLDYLKKTIEFLKTKGTVVLLRLPIINEMYMIEKDLSPNFDDRMSAISDKYEMDYINLMPSRNEYSYFDGHHLTYDSGKKCSQFLAHYLKNHDLQ